MTKKKTCKKNIREEKTNNGNNNELENLKKELEKLKEENKKLNKQLEEKDEILKNTQLQYLTLKNDFDLLTRRMKENELKLKDEILEKTILKFLPIFEDFMKSYEHLPEEFKEHKWTEWLSLINKKLNNFLQEYNIEIIKTVWEEVDDNLHEIIWVEPSDEKNKVIKEITKGYLIKKWDDIKVLKPAKVIVWQ